MLYYIYKIENIDNGRIYIGLTNNIKRRRARHFTDLKCNRHDNSFLQKEYNIYGKDKFLFSIEFEGDVSNEEISKKEQEYIKKYDSYRNGYNQNEGGNFGPSNGGSHLTQSDIFNILSALEFMSRPGQVLADIYNVSRTTISRIKKGENHIQYKKEYEDLPKEQRLEIYNIFCSSSNFYEDKINTTIIKSKRKLTEQQIHLLLLNEELNRPIPLEKLLHNFNIKSSNTFFAIKKGLSYKDYSLSYNKLTNDQKEQLASLLRNQQQ